MAGAPNLGKSNPSLRVLLADDHLRVLNGVKTLLENDYQIVASVGSGKVALEKALELRPDLIVLDIEMPEMNGIQAAEEMRRQGLKARILFLTVHDDEDYIAAARACGDGYVLKSRMATDLRRAIQEAFAGQFFVSQRILEAS